MSLAKLHVLCPAACKRMATANSFKKMASAIQQPACGQDTESLSELFDNLSCPAQHGKMHQIGVPWTNLFTGLETWNSFTISHSYPHTLICFCHQALMSALSRGLNQGIMFSSVTEGTKLAFLLYCLSGKDGRASRWLWRIGPLVHVLHQATYLPAKLSWMLTSNFCF